MAPLVHSWRAWLDTGAFGREVVRYEVNGHRVPAALGLVARRFIQWRYFGKGAA